MSISEHKHMPEPVRRVEVFTGAGRRRSWSRDEKAAIIAERYGAGETVCAVGAPSRADPATAVHLTPVGPAIRVGVADNVCAGGG
jgi:hypothetical protein